MKYQIVFLEQAEYNLLSLKNYITTHFSNEIWQKSYNKIKEAISNLKKHPLTGSVPPELGELNISQYRQIIAGMNRIIYEVREDMIYIHMVADSRRDMTSLLSKLLLRS